MLVGCAKVIGMPVASLVDAVTSFFEYFSFLYDFVVFWHGCISRLLARLPTADIHVCLIKNIFDFVLFFDFVSFMMFRMDDFEINS